MASKLFARLFSAPPTFKFRVSASFTQFARSMSGTTHHKVEIYGTNIHYDKAGTGDHVILCMPGALGSSQTDFKPQLEGIDGDKFTVIAWDPKGYGKSRPPNRKFSRDFFLKDSKDALDLMKKIGYERYSLLGWSDGGNSSIIMAAHHPNHIRKMVVWGANASVTYDDLKLYEATRDISNWSERMKQPMVEMYGAEYFQKTWSQWIDALGKIFTDKEGDICRQDTARVKCPTLIVHGEKDPMVPRFHPDYLHKNIPGSRLHLMPDGKHNLHLKYHKEFNKLVEDFLSEPSSHL